MHLVPVWRQRPSIPKRNSLVARNFRLCDARHRVELLLPKQIDQLPHSTDVDYHGILFLFNLGPCSNNAWRLEGDVVRPSPGRT